MTYEFNPNDSDWSLPNPFRFENFFLIITSLVLFGGGVAVTLIARGFIQESEMKVGIATMGLALLLFAASVKFGFQALSQMRFFFGRQFPVGLATQLPVSGTGDSESAVQVREIMRQRAIEFPEPTGPLNGVLYSLFKQLITSPPPIQAAAVQHFHSIVGMAAILGSLVVSYVVFEGNKHEGIISWMYLPITGLSLLTPFMRNEKPEVMPSSTKMLWKLIGLVTFAIIGPVVIPQYVPAMPIPPMWAAPTLLLIGSMIASVLFLVSLLSQMDSAEQTSVSCEQTKIAMNCPPSQLWTEISRDFQNNWVRNIPNRSYSNVPPDVSASERGSFSGCILEETQPMPTSTMVFDSLRDAWGVKYVRYLFLLSAWGILLSMSAVGVAVYFAQAFGEMSRMEISRIMLIVIALEVATVLSYRIGHLLWSRMYFRSRLIWIETSGTYQTSNLSIGNQMTGKALSNSTLTRVEDATLRVWVTDIVSVAFGKDGSRSIMALAPVDGVAKTMADKLVKFAADQSSIATPMSQRDVGKANAIRALDRSLQGNDSAAINIGLIASMQQNEMLGNNASADVNTGSGTVKFYNTEREFGFIIGDDGVERFFNSNQLGGQIVDKGAKVTFTPAHTARGPQANKVRIRA